MEDRSTPSTCEPASTTRWLKPRSARRFALVEQQLLTALLTTLVVLAGTLGYWLLGKVSWNHDAQVSQSFQPASFEVLTNRPQGAALELHHALITGDFALAKRLVTTEAYSLVEAAEQACGQSCPTPQRSRGRVFTRASLLDNNGRNATVRAESFDPNGVLLKASTYDIARENERWLITVQRPE